MLNGAGKHNIPKSASYPDTRLWPRVSTNTNLAIFQRCVEDDSHCLGWLVTMAIFSAPQPSFIYQLSTKPLKICTGLPCSPKGIKAHAPYTATKCNVSWGLDAFLVVQIVSIRVSMTTRWAIFSKRGTKTLTQPLPQDRATCFATSSANLLPNGQHHPSHHPSHPTYITILPTAFSCSIHKSTLVGPHLHLRSHAFSLRTHRIRYSHLQPPPDSKQQPSSWGKQAVLPVSSHPWPSPSPL